MGRASFQQKGQTTADNSRSYSEADMQERRPSRQYACSV